jgi:hypothetical protein
MAPSCFRSTQVIIDLMTLCDKSIKYITFFHLNIIY